MRSFSAAHPGRRAEPHAVVGTAGGGELGIQREVWSGVGVDEVSTLVRCVLLSRILHSFSVLYYPCVGAFVSRLRRQPTCRCHWRPQPSSPGMCVYIYIYSSIDYLELHDILFRYQAQHANIANAEHLMYFTPSSSPFSFPFPSPSLSRLP